MWVHSLGSLSPWGSECVCPFIRLVFLCIVSAPVHAVTTNCIDLAPHLSEHRAVFKVG